MFHKKMSIRISPGAYIGLCALILIFPLKWILSWVSAAVIHEFSHYIVLRWCHVRILSVEISLNGAKIITEPLSIWKECIAALAGPLSGFILILTAQWFPYLAVCAFFQTILNMIPIRMLDGGRIVNCLLRLFFSNKLAQQISIALEWVSLLLVLCFGIYLSVRYDFGILIPFLSVMFILRRFKTKTPCKHGKQIVQCIQSNIRGRKHE